MPDQSWQMCCLNILQKVLVIDKGLFWVPCHGNILRRYLLWDVVVFIIHQGHINIFIYIRETYISIPVRCWYFCTCGKYKCIICRNGMHLLTINVTNAWVKGAHFWSSSEENMSRTQDL